MLCDKLCVDVGHAFVLVLPASPTDFLLSWIAGLLMETSSCQAMVSSPGRNLLLSMIPLTCITSCPCSRLRS